MDEKLLKALAHVVFKALVDKSRPFSFKPDASTSDDPEINRVINEIFAYYRAK